MNNKFFPSNFLFIMIMVVGTFITLSSSHWLTMWMGLEINLMGFLPLMNIKGKMMEAEASMKYFIIQSLSSSMLIMSSLMMYKYSLSWYSMFNNNMLSTLLMMSLILKLGGAPLHFWLPNMTKQMTWLILFMMLTWQKMAPLFMLNLINNNLNIIIMISMVSTLVGSIMILNQTNMQLIITYSSISHLGWMLSMIMINSSMTFIYFFNYIIISIPLIYLLNSQTNNYMYMLTHKNKYNKFIIPSLILSLAGLPPFLGFMSKLLMLISLMKMNLILLTLFMLISTLISLYFYMNMTLMTTIKSYYLFNNLLITKPYNSTIIMINMSSVFIFYLFINMMIK
uniref:NADH-ubiquinone oxidoreductase chain 2 n=1 Tax=Sepia latimanus TaxID=3248881 RepID=T2HNY4_SEPLA|nr:NADH dehydrogenase subunit 2 [Sepia latimanus]QIC20336.1 NADH dehydrogenase subunit 2 [Sepia latimanus]BAN81946.1 NADH dehydrogenase subunit 2 [Sepia latimanus]